MEESDAEKTPKKKKGKDEKGVKFDGLIPTTSNQTAATNQGLNLSSTSLILFEDVSIYFTRDHDEIMTDICRLNHVTKFVISELNYFSIVKCLNNM